MEKQEEPRTEFQHYIEDQVLIVGPKEEFEDRLRPMADEFGVRFSLTSDGTVPLGRLEWDPGRAEGIEKCLDSIFPNLWKCLEKQLEMRLYRITPVQPGVREPRLVERVVSLINQASAESESCVRADLNWLIGYPYSVAGSPYSVAGSPNAVAGNPYSVAGSPYSVAGSPYSVAGSGFARDGSPVGPDDFWNQWGLETIRLFQQGNRTTKRHGHGVRVGVFDTSPFAEEGKQGPVCEGHPPSLTVVHPRVFQHDRLPPPPTPRSERGEVPPGPPDLSSHGLSVAGLVYAVAPCSDIYLYRVLDKHARGSLFVLCHALIEFVADVLSSPDAPNGAVVNLSLGLDLPVDWRERAGSESITALDTVLAVANCLGITVVAAAGNRSAGLADAVDAEFPASRPYAVGVMGSNYGDDRSCFSNKGELAAPGGDGYDCTMHIEQTSEYDTCKCPWEVEGIDRWKYGLIGPVLPSKKFPLGFARWIGTSFATPLVSGMAALVREHPGGPSQLGVRGEILNHLRAVGGEIIGGIIDVTGY